MSLTSYWAAPPRAGVGCLIVGSGARTGGWWIGRPGGDLLSRALRHSTMGAGEFHGRVRDGIGCRLPAMATRSSNPPWHAIAGFQSSGVRRPGWGVLVVCCVRLTTDVCWRSASASGDDFHAWCAVSSHKRSFLTTDAWQLTIGMYRADRAIRTS